MFVDKMLNQSNVSNSISSDTQVLDYSMTTFKNAEPKKVLWESKHSVIVQVTMWKQVFSSECILSGHGSMKELRLGVFVLCI